MPTAVVWITSKVSERGANARLAAPAMHTTASAIVRRSSARAGHANGANSRRSGRPAASCGVCSAMVVVMMVRTPTRLSSARKGSGRPRHAGAQKSSGSSAQSASGASKRAPVSIRSEPRLRARINTPPANSAGRNAPSAAVTSISVRSLQASVLEAMNRCSFGIAAKRSDIAIDKPTIERPASDLSKRAESGTRSSVGSTARATQSPASVVSRASGCCE